MSISFDGQRGLIVIPTLERTEVTTGSGVEFAALIPISRMEALGREFTQFPVLAHTLPPSAGVDGVLGLDFLRGRLLSIDFQNGRLTLAEPSHAADRKPPGHAPS